MKIRFALSAVLISFVLSLLPTQVSALSADPQISPDYSQGYERDLFKHWIDADKNGCNTRAEVLIAEAVTKPKVGKKCALTGGKWVSAYDAKTITDASKLDVDHLVPLAEAWRSGAWAWTAKQRQDYANDLSDSRALIAVTLNSNRSKSDKDISDWLPAIDKCGYVKNWVAIKLRYSLTYDEGEALVMRNYFQSCNIGEIKVAVLPEYKYQSSSVAPTPVLGMKITSGLDLIIPLLPTVAAWKSWKQILRVDHKGTLEFAVEDPPIGILTEDLNDACVAISVTTESDGIVYENSTITVKVRCRWVKAESVAGAGWKWREGKSNTPIEATSCAKLIEVEIDGIKALACAPPENAPKATPTPAPTSNGPKQCWVNGYTTKKGTNVKGYYRSC